MIADASHHLKNLSVNQIRMHPPIFEVTLTFRRQIVCYQHVSTRMQEVARLLTIQSGHIYVIVMLIGNDSKLEIFEWNLLHDFIRDTGWLAIKLQVINHTIDCDIVEKHLIVNL